MPRPILANIFLVSHNILQFCKICPIRKILPILHSAPCNNWLFSSFTDIMLDNSKIYDGCLIGNKNLILEKLIVTSLFNLA